MSDMIERMARALMSVNGTGCDVREGCENASEGLCACRRDARAAMSAFREPSTAMLIAGVKAMRNPDLDVTEKELALGWRAMISKAMEG